MTNWFPSNLSFKNLKDTQLHKSNKVDMCSTRITQFTLKCHGKQYKLCYKHKFYLSKEEATEKDASLESYEDRATKPNTKIQRLPPQFLYTIREQVANINNHLRLQVTSCYGKWERFLRYHFITPNLVKRLLCVLTQHNDPK